MIKYTNEELLEVLPSSLRESKELTTKQKVILGQLIIYNGLNVVKKDGYFYRSNKDLCNDCDIQEKTLIAAVNKLVMLGFIDRKTGSRKDGASLYRINQKLIVDDCRMQVDDNCKKEIEDYSNDYSKQIVEMSSRIKELEITVKMLVDKIAVLETANCSTETDTELEIDKEIESSNINNEKQVESASLEQIMQSSADDDEEQYQQWLQLLEPYISEVTEAKSLVQLNDIKYKMEQVVSNYLDLHNTSSTVMDKVDKHVLPILNKKLRSLRCNLQPTEMDVAEYVRQRNA